MFLVCPNWKHRRTRADPNCHSSRPTQCLSLLDLIAALAAGVLTLLAARWYAHSRATPAQPAVEVARAVGEAVGRTPACAAARRPARPHGRDGLPADARACVTLRRRRSLLGVLAVLVRRVRLIQHLDNSVAAWGIRPPQRRPRPAACSAITELGKPRRSSSGWRSCSCVVDLYRRGAAGRCSSSSPCSPAWKLVMLGVKDLVGRVRPDARPGGRRRSARRSRAAIPRPRPRSTPPRRSMIGRRLAGARGRS